MATPTYIDANDFIQALKDQGLVIISVKDFEAGKEIERNRLLRRKALSLSEIVKAKLLPLETTKGVNDWILSGKIKANEWYQEAAGYKRVMVLTAAIKRLGYGE